MAGIICFEAEWLIDQPNNRLGTNREHLMRYLSEEFNIKCVYRRVATIEELEYYLNEAPKYLPEYDTYNIIYFSFHGRAHVIHFASGESLTLEELADINPDFFRNRYVHFGSCRTMWGSEDEMANFIDITRAKIISGYTKSVDSCLCAIHDIALFNEYVTSKQLPPLLRRMQTLYGGLEEQLGFTTYPKFI